MTNVSNVNNFEPQNYSTQLFIDTFSEYPQVEITSQSVDTSKRIESNSIKNEHFSQRTLPKQIETTETIPNQQSTKLETPKSLNVPNKRSTGIGMLNLLNYKSPYKHTSNCLSQLNVLTNISQSFVGYGYVSEEDAGQASHPINKDVKNQTKLTNRIQLKSCFSSLNQTQLNHVRQSISNEFNQKIISKDDKQGLLYVHDTVTGVEFLIDTGSEVSLFPKSALQDNDFNQQPIPYDLIAANGQSLKTYGYKHVRWKNNQQSFDFNYIVADVPNAILGLDFIRKYDLVLRPKTNQCFSILLDRFLFVRQASGDMKSMQVKRDANNPVVQLIHSYAAVFDDSPTKLKHSDDIQHYIYTYGDPINSKNRTYSPPVEQKIEDYFKDLLDRDVVEYSSSNYSSPIVVVYKSSGDLRVCGDFRRINAVTRNDAYTLHRLSAFNNHMKGATVFSSIDIKTAYHQIPVYFKHRFKTAVHTPLGLLQFKKMPFGLKTASQTWQRFMDKLFMKYNRFVFVYIDDIIVFSKNEKEHLKHIETVIKDLREHGVKANLEKSKFLCESIDFLGYQVNRDGYRPSPNRIKSIIEHPVPKTAQQLRRFLCMMNYHMKFIKNGHQLTAPLYDLYPKKEIDFKKPIVLSNEHLICFERLKQRLSNAILLHHPDPLSPLIVETDASQVGFGAVISQVDRSGLKPLFFYSHKFSRQQKHLDIESRELEAIYFTVTKHNNYLIGRDCILYSDNMNLVKLLRNTPENVDQQKLKKLITISQYFTEIHYIDSKSNVSADCLSRIHSNSLYLDKRINYQSLFSDQQTSEWINQLQASDYFKKQIVQVGQVNHLIWIHVDNLNNQLICVPENQRRVVFEAYHSIHHAGYITSTRILASRFFWPSMKEDIREFCKSCVICKRTKSARKNIVETSPISVPPYRFHHLNMDIVGPMPVDENKNLYILTMIDRFSRFLTAIPLQETSSETIIKAINQNYIAVFGIPSIIHTDNASYFKSKVFDQWSSYLGIKISYSLTYSPWMNGMIERVHRKLKQSLRSYNQREWSSVLPFVVQAWNNSVVNGCPFTPAQLVFGQNQKLPGDVLINCTVLESPNFDFAEKIKYLISQFTPIIPQHHTNQNTTRLFKYAKLNETPYVMITNETPKNKLDLQFIGPYRVITRKDNIFTIDRDGKQENVHISRVIPAIELIDDLVR